MNQSDNTTLAAAIEYVRLGYAVLPLAPREKRPHSRLVQNGLKGATTDLEKLRQWWKVAPGAGVGLLPPPQVLVLDLDAPEAWVRLKAEFPELLSAPRQATPRGGKHVFLRLPAGAPEVSASTAILEGADIRGMGRAYLVAAPTRLPNGSYEWEVPLLPPSDLPLIPEELLSRLLPPLPAPPPEYHPQKLGGTTGDARARLLSGILRWACERVAAAPEGTRHNTLLNHSRLIGGYLHYGLDFEEAARALADAGVRAGLPQREAEATARDGLRYGQSAPLELAQPNSRTGATPLATPQRQSPQAPDPEPTNTKKLLELALTNAELWHDKQRKGWATVGVNGHKENWPIRSRRFELWLSGLFYEAREKAPSAQAINDAQGALEARAIFKGPERSTYIRVAPLLGEIWFDLGREGWDAVHITAQGWGVSAPGVRFRRSDITGALPVPEKGGGGEALRAIFDPWDIDEGARALLIAWLLGTLGAGPYPILGLVGEQGSGKSTLARMLQRLVDPGGDLGAPPRDTGELFLAAKNSHVLVFDNISSLPAWLSDDLCRLATGGMLRKRRLYSDDEEVFLPVRNPAVLTGISDYITSQDLLDRSIVLNLPSVDFHQPEADLWRDFEEKHARALGDLLDLAALALGNFPRTPTPNIRMADFARWALAAEAGYAPTGAFETAFADARGEALRTALGDDPVYSALRQLVKQGPFEGSAGELLEELSKLRGSGFTPPSWPPTPNAMGTWLKRNAPALRKLGIQAAPLPRQKGKRGWRVVVGEEQVPTTPKHPIPAPTNELANGEEDALSREGVDPQENQSVIPFTAPLAPKAPLPPVIGQKKEEGAPPGKGAPRPPGTEPPLVQEEAGADAEEVEPTPLRIQQTAALRVHALLSEEATTLAASAVKLEAPTLRLYLDGAPGEPCLIEKKSPEEIARIAYSLVEEATLSHPLGTREIRAEWPGDWPMIAHSVLLWARHLVRTEAV